MAIRASAGQVVIYNYNTGREGANPPISFQDIHENTSNFTYSILARVTSSIPANLIHYNAADGGYVQINHDGTNWYLRVRVLSINFDTIYFAPVALNTWTQFVVVVALPFIDIYSGDEVSGSTNIKLTQRTHQAYPFGLNTPFTFSSIAVIASANTSICNHKYWNTALPLNQFEDQAGRWDYDGIGTLPMWSSTLRTPGDISNIAWPYTSFNWAAGHGYSLIDHPENIVFDPIDPTYMGNNLLCPTWLYPVLNPVGVDVSVNPGTTPAAPTIYKGAPFIQFHDRGSVPITTPFGSIMYYALPYKDGASPGQTDTYPLYRDEHGVEVATDVTNRFEVNTGVPLPAAVFSFNMYDWVYAAQFKYGPPAGQVAAVGHVNFQHLYVKYIGHPPGVGIPHVPGVPPVPPPIEPPPPEPGPGEPPVPPPQPQPVAMSGLFAIKAGATTDKYDATIELKIPDPTIRTAYIGE